MGGEDLAQVGELGAIEAHDVEGLVQIKECDRRLQRGSVGGRYEIGNEGGDEDQHDRAANDATADENVSR